MTALAERKQQLPDTLEDLSRFVLVGREKLNAVRAEIRAIQKVGLAKEVHAQKLVEAQEIAEAVLDAEVKLGELTARMEKANANQYTVQKDTAVPKQKRLEEIGITEKQKQRYEKLAKHPKAVESAKAIAREEGRVVSRQDVLDLIVDPPAPTLRPTPQEFIRETEKEHASFLEQKKQGVVSIEAARADKERKELIILQTKNKIRKALRGIDALPIQLNAKDIEMVAENSSEASLKDLINAVVYSRKYLEFLEKTLSEARA